ncbi:polyprenyl synthetase family protein [Demequina activiva]|uniref:Polyprenyl synthetase family protein n=1 Tax=Demequina activiva TaxID=1582364 RepID=A0A919Q2L0_9MICO|nr:polyprenyl synthetase family protein [Demequina activiva]GIG54706.1 hypothetical protein Dac01nite_14580 [Demequina activiva]
MTTQETWREAIDERIRRTLEESSAVAATAGPALAEITAPMLDAARGGKRLRALLLLASHAAHGGDPQADAALDVATALELFQTAALLHDDVLDDSDTRRGRPSAHRRIADLHRRTGWLGDAHAYGAAGGILAGDLTLMACQRALTRGVLLLDPQRSVLAATMFADMTDLVTAGQYADMRAAAQPLEAIPAQREDILAVMRSKTASYTCEYPLALGAALAGADAAAVSRMRDIGVDLGIAFQLRDDLLGLTGSPEVTGKPAGDDVREGKRTFVLWRAWAETDDEGRARIGAVLGDRDATDAEVAAAIAVVTATDAEQWCEREIAERASRSRDALARSALDVELAEDLNALIDRAVARSS